MFNGDDDNEAVTSQTSSTAQAPSTRTQEEILNAPLAKADAEEFGDILIQPLMDLFTAYTSTVNRTKGGEYLSQAKASALMEAFPRLKDSFIANVNWKAALLAGWDLKADEELKREGLTRAQYDYFVKTLNSNIDEYIRVQVRYLSLAARVKAKMRDITFAQVAAYQIWKRGWYETLMNRGYKAYQEIIKALKDKNLTELNFRDKSLTILPSSDLWNPMTKLRTLTISSNTIRDIGFVKELVGLERLFLRSCGLYDVISLGGLVNLWDLDLSINETDDASILSKLVNLRWLKLSCNRISTLNFISGLKRLSKLSIDQNRVSELNPLRVLENLTYLNLLINPQLWAPLCGEAPDAAAARIQANRDVVATLRSRGCEIGV